MSYDVPSGVFFRAHGDKVGLGGCQRRFVNVMGPPVAWGCHGGMIEPVGGVRGPWQHVIVVTFAITENFFCSVRELALTLN